MMILCSVLSVLILAGTDSTLIVSTDVGNIRGFQSHVRVNGNIKTVTKYMGVPYANPPTGYNRFRKPVPKTPMNVTYDATRNPPSCDAGTSMFSEDCLYLNVYVPDALTTGSLPVMVWIHGGGFKTGTSSGSHVDALSIYGHVIVVTLNYRLGIFGFLRSDNGDFPGNQGLWDQHLAITWVHNNIHHFGGDPGQVTLFGQSAGSKSVMYQSLYAGNRGLFQRIICESGSALEERALSLKSNAENVLNATGCVLDTVDGLACLRSKSVHALHGVKSDYRPVIDGQFVIEHPVDIVYGNNSKSQLAREFYGSLDVIAGVNTLDGALFLSFEWPNLLHETKDNITITRHQFENVIVPWVVENTFHPEDEKTRKLVTDAIISNYTDWSDPDNASVIRLNVVNMTSDFTYYKSTILAVQGHSQLRKARTYLYEFAVMPSHHLMKLPSWLQGPNHEDEIPFVFGYPIGNLSSRYSHDEVIVSRAMISMWTNFARTGNPNTPKDVTTYVSNQWPTYNMSTQHYFRITNQLSSACITQWFYQERMHFWLDFIPSILGQHRYVQHIQSNPDGVLIG